MRCVVISILPHAEFGPIGKTHPTLVNSWIQSFLRNREEEEERLRELEEDYEDDDFYSKKKKKKDNKKSANEWTEDDYNLLVKLLNKYPGNCSFQKIIQNGSSKNTFLRISF